MLFISRARPRLTFTLPHTKVGATLSGDDAAGSDRRRRPPHSGFPRFVVHRAAVSAALCGALFPPRTLCDKAPAAATDDRPQALGTQRGGAWDDAFFCVRSKLCR